MDIQIFPAGDTTLQVETSGGIKISNSIFLRELKVAIDSAHITGITETLCTYCTLMVHYRPDLLDYRSLENLLQEYCAKIQVPEDTTPSEVIEIPVLYGGEYGPDLEAVAQHENISADEVIQRHTGCDAYVYFIGFAPGHPYAGSAKPTFTVPRLLTPRVSIPRGSIVVWESQTCIYGADLPCGWHVIGRTPYDVFSPSSPEPFLLKAGQWLRFRAIDQSEYDRLRHQVETGTCRPHVIQEGGAAQ
ncbi:MAG: allophanate hydrolase subunit 1 [Bacteroidales bacterium]|nr:allophanate hydrolase subunit 1 [Bacteroidales bacterium]